MHAQYICFCRIDVACLNAIALYGFDLGFSIKKAEFLMVLKHQSFPEKLDKKTNIKQIRRPSLLPRKPRSEMVSFQQNSLVVKFLLSS